MTKLQKVILSLFIVISLLGLADAGYLTYEHYAPFPLPCSNFACETVTTSKYSILFNVIPLSLMGVFYYVTVLLGSIVTLSLKNERLLRLLSLFTIAGFMTSLYLVYLQVFVLHAICIYCMASAGTSTLLFVVGMVYLLRSKKVSEEVTTD